jgi:putative tricarboxylic transport membrane protein
MEVDDSKPVASVKTLEIIVAVLFLIFGAIVVWDSRRLGASWGSDGPQAGYFPFYVGMLICIASFFNLVRAFWMGEKGREGFVERGQLKMILTVMIPTVIYVAVIANPWYPLGFYVASAIFIALFMRHLGKYSWAMVASVSIGTMFFFFLMFEIWFKVPLPKGPLEAALGFG